MRSAILIYNPTSGRGRTSETVDAILDRLRKGGFDVEAQPTTAPGSATEQARAAADAGYEAVFAFGGDGTLRETAVGLLGTTTALGFVPGGTVNVMTLTLGLPSRAIPAAEALAGAQVRTFDVGLCNDRPFLMQASAGIDAAFIARLDSRLKRHLAKGAILSAALGALASYRYPNVEVIADGEDLEATLAVVSNIPFYGGKWQIAPDARTDDERLNLVTFCGRGRSATLGFARDLLLGRHLGRPDVATRSVREVVLRGTEDLPVQIDGDTFGEPSPVRIRLAPKRLRVFAL